MSVEVILKIYLTQQLYLKNTQKAPIIRCLYQLNQVSKYWNNETREHLAYIKNKIVNVLHQNKKSLKNTKG